jgi:uncharacterized protein (DUF58 family)
MLQTRVNNFRRVYRLSHWFRLRFTPMGHLLLLAIVVSGVIGIDTTRNLSYQIFCLLLTLIVLAILFSAFNRERFSCQRRLPAVATVGEPLQYYLSIVNQSTKAAAELYVTEQLGEQFPTEEQLRQFRDTASKRENRFDRVVGFPRWLRLMRIRSGARAPTVTIPGLPPRQKLDLPVSLTPLRRGYLHFSATYLGSPDPSGLFRSFSVNPNPDSLLVLPKRYPVPKLDLNGRRHYHPGGVALASAIGETHEFHGLRDYQPGDPLRHIHWRSWARSTKPVVKKYEDEFFVRHALLLDTYTQNVGSLQFEEAVSTAASLAWEISDQESLLDLMFVNQRAFQFTSGRHTSDLRSMLEILANVKEETEQPFETLSQLVMEHCSQLSSVIAVFLQWDQPRKTLIRFLNERGINTLVLQVCNAEHTRDLNDALGKDQPPWLRRLYVGDMEAGLAGLSQWQQD